MKKIFTNTPLFGSISHTPSSRRVSARDIKNKWSFPKFVIGNLNLINKQAAEVPDNNTRGRRYINGFTLIELLVVVLIIGILSAVALPQYQKAVERSKMAEAVTMVRAIANAHQVYYLANGVYLNPQQIDLLDITVPGTAAPASARIQTKDFVYAPNGCGSSCTDPEHLSGYLALATRVSANNEEQYTIFITKEYPNRIHCGYREPASTIQRQLCTALDSNGTL